MFALDITGWLERRQDQSLNQVELAGPMLKAGPEGGGFMSGMAKWMLGAAVVAGGLGLGATTAQAAEFGVYVRGPVAYVPPCPGAGYVWTAGYQANGYWIPGRWDFRGVRGGDHFARVEGGRDFNRNYARFDRRDDRVRGRSGPDRGYRDRDRR